MKRINIRQLIFICIFIFAKSVINAQPKPIEIDDLYITSLEYFYNTADQVKSEIWKGMQLAPVCLFRNNGPALLYNHPNPPQSFTKVKDKLYIGTQKDLRLFGATQMEINGVLTAIVDYGLARYSSIEETYSELFHELHHVHQRNFVKQIGFDNPATLLTYPEHYINDGIKLFEQKTLYKMCMTQDENDFQKLLNQFYSCRLKRQQIIGEFIKYEEMVESMEGPAFYCEYRFYNKVSSLEGVLKDNYNQKHFFGFLTTPFYGREGLRNRHLGAGMAMCLILDRYFDNWQVEYYSKELSLYDFFMSRFKPQQEALDIDPKYYDLSKFHINQVVEQRQASFTKFNAQQGIKITLKFDQHPQFRGFDPMHAESINDSTVLHTTLLRLAGNQNDHVFINNKDAVTVIDGKIWFVREIILFAPKESIIAENDRIAVDAEGRNISWTGKPLMKTETEIVFNCK